MMDRDTAKGLGGLIRSQVGQHATVARQHQYCAGRLSYTVAVQDRITAKRFVVLNPTHWFETVCVNFPAPEF